ncbi:sensor histidine kinase [Floricoccus penangensis]|uniref:sensor histidine kinase n=1 Tax=Floricoccus penangensis TaxID=1859475 RepID=UPI0020424FBA|nr:HAMP domain-containing sensor histidine kinase [Floricoccus penangensis]URZ87376.1 HAMP domain-containing histidine kinase [Floricoccus penangensis]
MGNQKSIGRLILRYSIIELLYTVFTLILFAFLLNFLVIKNIIYPASYLSEQLPIVEKNFKNKDWNVEDIPYFYDYRLVDGNKIIQTIDSKYDSYIKEAKKDGSAMNSVLFANRKFVYLKNGDKELTVSFRFSPIFTSKKLYQFIPNFEETYWLIFLVTWIIGFLLLVRRTSIIINRELAKVSQTNSYIKQMRLDYPRENSKYKEVNELLFSLDSMSEELKKSLELQWSMQDKEKELIQSVTHDIRTPITLIKGNLELLEEESKNHDNELIEDIQNGVERLEAYVSKLSNLSKEINSVGKKEFISKDVIDYWNNNLVSICQTNNRNLKVLNKDTNYKLLIDKEGIERALENIIMNSIENSQKSSDIFISYVSDELGYKIEVVDQGEGFDEERLQYYTDKYFTSKSNDGTEHGLGLYIVNDIVKENNGNLILGNAYKEGKIQGAKVALHFMIT